MMPQTGKMDFTSLTPRHAPVILLLLAHGCRSRGAGLISQWGLHPPYLPAERNRQSASVDIPTGRRGLAADNTEHSWRGGVEQESEIG